MTRHTRVASVRTFDQEWPGDEYTYVGRPMPRHRFAQVRKGSVFGNPFKRDHPDPLRAYRDHVLANPELVALLPALRGKTLVCWCCAGTPAIERGDVRCHAEVLALLCDGYLLED